MLHHRSPTRTGYPSIHATLALRHSIPTLLSPLRSVVNTPRLGSPDALDDFQSNAWLDAPSYRPPLAGLGITYLRDDDPTLRMHVDRAGRHLSLPSLGHFSAPTVPYAGIGSEPMDLGFDGEIGPASDTVGLIPDVNMYDQLRRLDLPHPGVNPLDTIRTTPLQDIGFSCDEPAPLTPENEHTADIPSTMDARPEQSPSPRVIQDIMSILIQPAPEFSLPSANLPSTQDLASSLPTASGSSMSVKTNARDGEHPPGRSNTHSSPVLNAHLGIELSELVSKAGRFRTRYPGRDIDRAWLSHFAGKLSDRGELLNDFRCYVVGCDQRNKRRDHILVHVGAHIGQRPFACTVCPMRFLRKNECKRHEASHSGSRPYSCDICGQSFVRQDLVKRHVKRTHGVRDENHPGVAKQSTSRKRARLR